MSPPRRPGGKRLTPTSIHQLLLAPPSNLGRSFPSRPTLSGGELCNLASFASNATAPCLRGAGGDGYCLGVATLD